eukprot:CAMPEP_0182574976 /NCGR_PEP_ID=MMETSP1324-20130603/28178_1 /TAXON_ID=236786 /ORGANISM="Florenciella sp., Strain RCC1587" /LENGTH=181 /DNA_ID=CAMNT_0024790475 /DNA_START=33 /DNA_END=574 /DNA_ORIENTATION=-
MRPLLKPTDRILVVGCGNSPFTAALYDDGFKNVTSIDFSPTVIKAMAARHAEARPELKWLTMDMLDLKFDDESFDVVIDKAAMDALMTDEGSVWDPAQATRDAADAMCRESSRVLVKGGGVFICVSFAQPHFRIKYLEAFGEVGEDRVVERYDWTLQPHTVIGDGGVSGVVHLHGAAEVTL